jgi:hypothetical protein
MDVILWFFVEMGEKRCKREKSESWKVGSDGLPKKKGVKSDKRGGVCFLILI